MFLVHVPMCFPKLSLTPSAAAPAARRPCALIPHNRNLGKTPLVRPLILSADGVYINPLGIYIDMSFVLLASQLAFD